MPSQIAYVTNASSQSGVGKPAREIARYLARQGEFQLHEYPLAAPSKRIPKPLQWWRAARRLPKEGFSAWHLTNQTLSFIRRAPAIITVYDLIELIEPQVKFGRPLAQALYSGIPRAAHLICVSQYTKQTLQEHYRISEENITVIPLAAADVFKPDAGAKQSASYQEFLRTWNLTPQHKVVLYVGSEHPRKNLTVLAEAFAHVHKEIPETVLLKVGDPGVAAGRKQFLSDLARLNIQSAVRFIGRAGDETLKLLYNIADVFVFPSTFEGFGIPPLEALACGCPVVSSNATSLPEVVGDAALLCSPGDEAAFAAAMLRVLTEPALVQDLRRRGLTQAAHFSWPDIAQQTAEVYRSVLAK